MKELTRFDEIKKLDPFTKILFVDKEKCTLEIIAFLYADELNDAVSTRFYACDPNKYGQDIVVHKVELEGVSDERQCDSKVVAKKITIGKRIL